MNYNLVKNIEWDDIEINNEIQQIPKCWKKVNVKDSVYLKARIGWQGLKSSEFIKEGIFYCVTGQDFVKNNIDWANCYKVTADRYEQDTKIQLTNGDVLITKDGTIGKIAKVDNIPEGYNATLNSGVFVSRTKNFSQDYWFFILKGNIFNNFVMKQKSGSTIVHLNQGDFESLEFPLPSEQEQANIAFILNKQENIISNIEKLIEKNEIVSKELFEKLLSGELRLKKESGKFSIHKNNESNLKEVAVNGEILNIPIDWNIENVDKNFKFQKGKPPKEKESNAIDDSYQKYLSMDVIRGNSKDIIYTNKGVDVKKGDLGILWDGSNAGEILTIKENGFLSSTIALITTKTDRFSKNFSFYLFKDIEKKIREQNQGGAIPHVDGSFLRNFLIKIPSINEQELIASFMDNQEKKITNLKQLLNKENEKFEWLLDNLLSGNYLVKEKEI